tara:strand:- start:49 stop:210 length:162 start_codon:yes stop_codon:yes gene_type:complete
MYRIGHEMFVAHRYVVSIMNSNAPVWLKVFLHVHFSVPEEEVFEVRDGWVYPK